MNASLHLFLPSFRLPLAVAAVFCAGLCAGQAQSTISYSFGLPMNQTTTDLDSSGTLGLFDSSLGTLTSAVLTLREDYHSTLSLTNNGATPENLRATSTMEFDWDPSIPAMDSFFNSPVTYTLFSTGLLTYTPGQSRSFPDADGANTRNIDVSSIIAQLQQPGGGNFLLAYFTLTRLSLSGNASNFAQNQNTTAGTAATITYTYTPVPESSSAMLILLGASATFAGRRRQRKIRGA